MNRERFKKLRRNITIVAGIIWLVLLMNIRSHEEHWYSLDAAAFMLTTWWIPFVIGHYVAKSKARSEYQEKVTEETTMAIRVAQEKEAEEIRDGRQRTLTRHRTLILDNLDSANNFIELFSDPMFQDQKTMAKQKLSGELYAITAAIPPNDLTEIIRTNKDIQIKVRQLNTRLKEHSIEDANAEIMLEAIKNG